jgi:hypothetical protein
MAPEEVTEAHRPGKSISGLGAGQSEAQASTDAITC